MQMLLNDYVSLGQFRCKCLWLSGIFGASSELWHSDTKSCMIQFTSLLEDTQNPGLLSELLSARHDSVWQTIVRRHIIQAEIITRERRASPSRQKNRGCDQTPWKKKDVEQWNVLRVLDGGPLPASALNTAENLSYFFLKKVSGEMDLRIKRI